MRTLIKNGQLVTMNSKKEILATNLLIEDSLIGHIGPGAKDQKKSEGHFDQVIDATDCFVVPGFIQGHLHLCQTLFRGLADDLSLLDWLKKRIWPLEAAHSEKSLFASAQLGILELLKSGTTTIVDMGTVKFTDALFEAVDTAAIRYIGGKCLMDVKPRSGPLWESFDETTRDLEGLIHRWNKKRELLEVALCPRFALSCSEELLEFCVDTKKKHDLYLHTHASENTEEIQMVKKLTKKTNIAYFEKLGLLGSKSILAHGVYVSEPEMKLLQKSKTVVAHCPNSNLKLASGIAPLTTYLKMGTRLMLGADGAACNNALDIFGEMKTASLLQKISHGPRSVPAQQMLELATIKSAAALGKQDLIGSLEVGKKADVVIIDRKKPHLYTVEDAYSAIVYSAQAQDVSHVFVNGQHLIRDRVSTRLDESKVLVAARNELKALLSRARL